MQIDKIISKSFEYVSKHKALWVFGFILAMFGGGASQSFNFPSGGGGGDGSGGSNFQMPQITQEQMGLIIALVVIAVIFLIIFGVLGAIVGNWSSAALMRGVNALEDGKAADSREMAKTGKTIVWRMIVLNNLIPLGFFMAFLALCGVFALLLLIPGITGKVIFGILIALLLIALIPLSIYFGIIWIIASRFVVLEDTTPVAAIKKSMSFIKGKFWWTFLLNMIYGLIGGMGGCLAGCLTLILVLIPGLLTIFFIGTQIWIGAVIAGLITLTIFPVYLIAIGFFVALRETGLTLWWREIKNQKQDGASLSK